MTGIVLAVDEPKIFSGTSKTGKPFSMTQRRIQLFTGNKQVEVTERLPDPVNGQPAPQFPPLDVLSKVTFKVTNIRAGTFGLNYDVAPL